MNSQESFNHQFMEANINKGSQSSAKEDGFTGREVIDISDEEVQENNVITVQNEQTHDGPILEDRPNHTSVFNNRPYYGPIFEDSPDYGTSREKRRISNEDSDNNDRENRRKKSSNNLSLEELKKRREELMKKKQEMEEEERRLEEEERRLEEEENNILHSVFRQIRKNAEDKKKDEEYLDSLTVFERSKVLHKRKCATYRSIWELEEVRNHIASFWDGKDIMNIFSAMLSFNGEDLGLKFKTTYFVYKQLFGTGPVLSKTISKKKETAKEFVENRTRGIPIRVKSLLQNSNGVVRIISSKLAWFEKLMRKYLKHRDEHGPTITKFLKSTKFEQFVKVNEYPQDDTNKQIRKHLQMLNVAIEESGKIEYTFQPKKMTAEKAEDLKFFSSLLRSYTPSELTIERDDYASYYSYGILQKTIQLSMDIIGKYLTELKVFGWYDFIEMSKHLNFAPQKLREIDVRGQTLLMNVDERFCKVFAKTVCASYQTLEKLSWTSYPLPAVLKAVSEMPRAPQTVFENVKEIHVNEILEVENGRYVAFPNVQTVDVSYEGYYKGYKQVTTVKKLKGASLNKLHMSLAHEDVETERSVQIFPNLESISCFAVRSYQPNDQQLELSNLKKLKINVFTENYPMRKMNILSRYPFNVHIQTHNMSSILFGSDENRFALSGRFESDELPQNVITKEDRFARNNMLYNFDSVNAFSPSGNNSIFVKAEHGKTWREISTLDVRSWNRETCYFSIFKNEKLEEKRTNALKTGEQIAESQKVTILEAGEEIANRAESFMEKALQDPLVHTLLFDFGKNDFEKGKRSAIRNRAGNVILTFEK